jgi:hypothetical protein
MLGSNKTRIVKLEQARGARARRYVFSIGCYARAASGHAAAAPPSSVMKSRRLMWDMGLPPAPE